MRTRATALLLISTLAPFTGGCSFAFVRGPPPAVDPREELTCSTSMAAPILDLLAGTGAAVATTGYWALATLLAELGGDSGLRQEDRLAIAGGIGATLAAFLSSSYGSRATAECREAHSWVAACNAGDGAACDRLGVGSLQPRGPPPSPAAAHEPRLTPPATSRSPGTPPAPDGPP